MSSIEQTASRKTRIVSAEKILSLTRGYWPAKAVLVAARLDVFSTLHRSGKRAEEVARRLNLDARATELLLNALVGLGFLRKSGERFSNTAHAERFLVRTSVENMLFMLRHHDNLWSLWSKLEETVRTGRAPRQKREKREERRDFALAMHQNSIPRARGAAERIDLRGRGRLLDLGGGVGTYAIEFCRRNRQLKATVFDRPVTRPYAEEVISKSRMARRIEFVGGDFNRDALGGPYDAAWLSAIIHSEGPRNVQRLFRRVGDCLKSGGLILVSDFFLNSDRTRPAPAALFSLNMLVATERGRSYSEEEVRGWLHEAGFVRIRRLRGVLRPPAGILAAEKIASV